jgi:hypothetical protein
MQNYKTAMEWRYFCRCIRKNQLKTSKLYQFRLDDSCPHKEQCLLSPCRKIRLQYALSHLNDIETEIVTYIERQFLNIRGWLYGAIEL